MRCAALIAFGASALGCSESPECQRMRLNLAKAWEGINQAAEEQKAATGEEVQWTAIQAKVAVLQSAFATPQITWDSATKNKDEATKLLDGIAGTGLKLEMLKATFNAAGTQQAAYYEACR